MARTEPLGTARVDFSANTRRFVTGVNQANNAFIRQQRVVRQLRRRMRQLSMTAGALRRRFLNIRTVVAGLAGSGGLGLLARNQAAYGASLVQVSQRLGFTVERMQLLRAAFAEYGVEQNSVDIGLQRFTRRLADAFRGNALL